MARIPLSAWIATGSLSVAAVALFLPWVDDPSPALAFVGLRISQDGFNALGSAGGTLTFVAILAGAVLLTFRLGFRTWTELEPSGPLREIPNLRVWMFLVAAWIVAAPLIVLLRTDGGSHVGLWTALAAGFILSATVPSGYVRAPEN